MLRRVAGIFRSLTPIPVRKFIHKAGMFFGAGLSDAEPFPSIRGALRTLRQLGLDPRFCIDVGAYQGEWTKLFKAEFPGAKILMIEAQASKHPILQQVAAAWPEAASVEIALLGATDGQSVKFTEMETGSSVFAETSEYSARAIVEKAVSRLDTVIRRGQYPPADFLKLDVQGYELEVLKGAPETLAQVSAVLLEASLVPVNAGCPPIAEVMAFMDRAGFQLFDFCSQIRRKDGVLWQTDLLFIRSDSKIVPQPILTYENWRDGLNQPEKPL